MAALLERREGAETGTTMGKQALEGKRLTAFAVDPADITVVEDPSHPLFDKEGNSLPLNEGLIKSIMKVGVIVPIVIFKDGEDALVVDGRQRRKNAIEVNRRKVAAGELPILVPVMVFKGTMQEAADLMEALNEIRREHNPMTRARKALDMVRAGRAVDDIATLLGKTVQTINNWLKLMDCSEAVQSAVESGQMTATTAISLTNLSRTEQDAALTKIAEEKAAIAADSSDASTSEPSAESAPPRQAGPKRTKSGSVSKSTLRKVYVRAVSAETEEEENALSDGERKILGWALGKITTDDLAKEIPGIYLLLGEKASDALDDEEQDDEDGITEESDETSGVEEAPELEREGEEDEAA